MHFICWITFTPLSLRCPLLRDIKLDAPFSLGWRIFFFFLIYNATTMHLLLSARQAFGLLARSLPTPSSPCCSRAHAPEEKEAREKARGDAGRWEKWSDGKGGDKREKTVVSRNIWGRRTGTNTEGERQKHDDNHTSRLVWAERRAREWDDSGLQGVW